MLGHTTASAVVYDSRARGSLRIIVQALPGYAPWCWSCTIFFFFCFLKEPHLSILS
ncbi:hypothetical protein GYMLUDRAFT_870051 [Collybiopsis luxurians FD-317 M1]|nr:hypothetical protein GYMLUDRAFT_870051 [Collybiopsis luxurians FD-317 M1]